MKANTNRPRFDVEMLRTFAGAKAFARGEAYHRGGQVEILLIEAERVLAEVSGTDEYRVELAGRGKKFAGECSCPAFGDWGFCKHLVATALAANELGDEESEASGVLARIREHLRQKGVDALVELVVDLATRDPALLRKLDSAAVPKDADDRTLRARLRKAIDRAIGISDFVSYREASDWASQVESVLDTIAELASVRAAVAIELAEYAIKGIEQAIGSIDNSDGHCGALLECAGDIHLAATCELRPEPVKLARELFVREMEDDYGIFNGAMVRYADALGEAELAEYRRLATEAWTKLRSRGRGRAQSEGSENGNQLMSILDFFAERDGDIDARIALRTKDLSSQWKYLQLAEFCRAQGRKDEALRRAEEGLWMFEDERTDDRLLSFVVDGLVKAGRKKEAEAHLWRAFEKQPTQDLYERLQKLGGKSACERALAFLEAEVLKGRTMRGQHWGWNVPADLLIRIRISEKNFDAAWAIVRKQGASMDLTMELAKASESTHPADALKVYLPQVDALVNSGDASAYAAAAKLIERMAKLRDRGEHVAYVLELKLRHARRRNFMKLLA